MRRFSRKSFLIIVLDFIPLLIVMTTQASGAPLYLPAITYASGGEVGTSVAVADFNGDGKLDVVVTNCGRYGWCGWADGLASVFLGNGDGTFQPAVGYDTGGQWANSVAVADVNGDGNPDLVVGNFWVNQTNNFNGTVGILLGNGDGTFQPHLTYGSGGSVAWAVAVADVNADGSPDVVVANCGPSGPANYCYGSLEGVVGVLLNNGDGTFQPPVSYDSGGNAAWSVAIADLNGDRKLDVVVTGARLGVLLGNGDGTFQPAITYDPGSGSVAIADINGDGKPDIVESGQYMLGNGDGTFQPPVTYSGGSVAAIADVNGDGRLDIIVTNGGVGVLLGYGNGTFQPVVNYKSGGARPVSVAVADVSGDGRPELLVAHNWVSASNDHGLLGVLLNNTAPNATRTVVTTSGSPSFINQSVTFTANIASTHGPIPDGKPVTFYDGTTAMGKGATLNGAAAFSTTSLIPKTHSIKAIFPGDIAFKPSFGTVRQVVVKYPTTTTLTSSPNPSNFGQVATFTATVSPTGPYPITGKVRFLDGSTAIGTVTVSGGVGKLVKSTLVVGTHAITAKYLGDSYNAQSTSAVVNQVVQ